MQLDKLLDIVGFVCDPLLLYRYTIYTSEIYCNHFDIKVNQKYTRFIFQLFQLLGTTASSNLTTDILTFRREMCLPFSVFVTCCSSLNSEEMPVTALSFSKPVLTSEETKQYQLPWEKQQSQLREYSEDPAGSSSSCTCLCCVFTFLCKAGFHNHHGNVTRQLSFSMTEKRPISYKELIDAIKPTFEQMNQWSEKFDKLLCDDGGRKLFTEFLRQEHSLENLLFWNEVESLKLMFGSGDTTTTVARARAVYTDFLKPMAEYEVNIAGKTRKEIEDHLELEHITEDIFDDAQSQVYSLMRRQSYPRFLISDLFKCVLQSTYTDLPNTSL